MPAKKSAKRKHAATKKATTAVPTVANEVERHLLAIRDRWSDIGTLAVREVHRLQGK